MTSIPDDYSSIQCDWCGKLILYKERTVDNVASPNIENIVDGDFEDDDLTLYWNPFSDDGTLPLISVGMSGSGYSAELPPNAGIQQAFNSITVSDIISASFYYKGYNCLLSFGPGHGLYLPDVDDWTPFNLLDWLKANCITQIDQILIVNFDESVITYIDNVSILTPGSGSGYVTITLCKYCAKFVTSSGTAVEGIAAMNNMKGIICGLAINPELSERWGYPWV